MFQCPRWVSTLQAAELWGWLQGVRLATHMNWPRVCVDSESIVARCQIQGQRGAVFAPVSNVSCEPCSGFAVGLGYPLRVFLFCLNGTELIRLAQYTILTRSCPVYARERYWQWHSSPFYPQGLHCSGPFPVG